MAKYQRRLHVICYDITEPKRLARVHRYLRRRGLAVQYSVFVVRAHTPALLRLLDELRKLINPQRDDIRAYPLPKRLDYQHLGRPLLPAGINLHGTDLPAELFRPSSDASAADPATTPTR